MMTMKMKLLQTTLLVSALSINIIVSRGKHIQPFPCSLEFDDESQIKQLIENALDILKQSDTGARDLSEAQTGSHTLGLAESGAVAGGPDEDDNLIDLLSAITTADHGTPSEPHSGDQESRNLARDLEPERLDNSDLEKLKFEPESISFDSDAVTSEQDFERVLENLKRLADGRAILVDPPTTARPSTTRPPRPITTEFPWNQNELTEWRSHRDLQRTRRRFPSHSRALSGDFLTEADLLSLCEDLRLESEMEEELRRERLRNEPDNIRQIEEFLQTRIGQVGPEVRWRATANEGNALAEVSRDDIDCRICMEPNTAEESIELNCGHAFHFDCLKTWFATIVDSPAKTCPICREKHWIL